jgi:hypothetical protein
MIAHEFAIRIVSILAFLSATSRVGEAPAFPTTLGFNRPAACLGSPGHYTQRMPADEIVSVRFLGDSNPAEGWLFNGERQRRLLLPRSDQPRCHRHLRLTLFSLLSRSTAESPSAEKST